LQQIKRSVLPLLIIFVRSRLIAHTLYGLFGLAEGTSFWRTENSRASACEDADEQKRAGAMIPPPRPRLAPVASLDVWDCELAFPLSTHQ